MGNATCSLFTATEINVDADGVTLYLNVPNEQKVIIRPDIYIVRTQNETMYCLNADAAWTHAYAAMKAKKLVSFDIELGNSVYQYENERRCFVFDCKVNPDAKRYRIRYWWDDESWFEQTATFAEAKEKADEEYGEVYAVSGQAIYFKREPDAYDAYWDAL